MKPSSDIDPQAGSQRTTATTTLRADAPPFIPAETSEAYHSQETREERKPTESLKCGVCLEQVSKLYPSRFGILENCSHVFCRPCIATWRGSKRWMAKTCPECRVYSSFVLTSSTWVDDPEKQTMISSQKQLMSCQPCRYFDEGRGECPYGVSCLRSHVYPDGTKQDKTELGAPVVIKFTYEPREGVSDGVSVHIFYPQTGRVEEIWARQEHLHHVLPFDIYGY